MGLIGTIAQGLIASAKNKNRSQCPLQVPKCKSLTVSEDVETRINDLQNGRYELEGLKNDLLFRGKDQLAWNFQCPKKYKVPFAVATSNGLFVRIMKEKNSDWQLATLKVNKFESLDCEKLAELLRTAYPAGVFDLNGFKEAAENCSNDDWQTEIGKKLALEHCKEFLAEDFLIPDTQFSKAMQRGEFSDAYEQMQLSLGSLTVRQRKQLGNARVAVFKCGKWQTFAWVGLVKNKPKRVLIITEGDSRKSVIKLRNVHWDRRCKKNLVSSP